MKENQANILFMVIGVMIGCRATDIIGAFAGPITLYLSLMVCLFIIVFGLIGTHSWIDIFDFALRSVCGIIMLALWIGLGMLFYTMNIGAFWALFLLPVAAGVFTILWSHYSNIITQYIKSKH